MITGLDIASVGILLGLIAYLIYTQGDK